MGWLYLILNLAVLLSFACSWSKMPSSLKEWTDKN